MWVPAGPILSADEVSGWKERRILLVAGVAHGLVVVTPTVPVHSLGYDLAAQEQEVAVPLRFTDRFRESSEVCQGVQPIDERVRWFCDPAVRQRRVFLQRPPSWQGAARPGAGEC